MAVFLYFQRLLLYFKNVIKVEIRRYFRIFTEYSVFDIARASWSVDYAFSLYQRIARGHYSNFSLLHCFVLVVNYCCLIQISGYTYLINFYIPLNENLSAIVY